MTTPELYLHQGLPVMGGSWCLLRGIAMLKTCSACGRLHDINALCPVMQEHRRKYISAYQKDHAAQAERNSQADLFRNTVAWRKKRRRIQQRDMYLCRWCYLTQHKITTAGLSVHHIVPLTDDYDLRLDDNNLITLCREHHEQAESGQISAADLKAAVRKMLKIDF